jgi:hypothetical protein
MRKLARRLLALEAARPGSAEARIPEAVRVCEKLRISLTRFAGADGFAALLRRALALATPEVPSLSGIKVNPDCSMEGLKALAAEDAKGALEAGAAITAHLLGLLVTFIGEPMTLRLVRESWPKATPDK